MIRIDPEISRARTLPSRFYTDEGTYRAALERIFSRSWQLVGRKEEIRKLHPVELCPGSLNEPVLLVADGDGISGFSNVCTHRGKILVEESCEAPSIRYPYHGRKFSLGGQCLSMPEFEGVEGFPSTSDDLKKLNVDTWNGFVFVSLDLNGQLNEYFADFETAIGGFDFGSLSLAGTRVYQVKANWALYCENYLEGFHIPFVHPGLNKEIEYGLYETSLARYSVLQTGRASIQKDDGPPPFTRGVEGLYLFLFPNTMLNFYPWGVSVNIVEPTGVDTTDVRYLTYVSDPRLTGRGAGGDLNTVELEDQAVVESVQKGVASRHYDRGRYSPSKETGTHHFHRLIAEFMAGDQEADPDWVTNE